MKKACNATLQCLRNVRFEIIQHVKNTKLNTQTRDKSRTCFVLPHLQLPTFMVESSFEHGKLVILGLEVVCSDYDVEASTLVERRGMKVNHRLSQGGRSIPYFSSQFFGRLFLTPVEPLNLSWTTAFRRRWCFVDVGGWGGACINVHVNLQMKYMLRFGCRQVHVFMGGVGWGGIITSMALSFMGHAAMLLYVLLSYALIDHATVLYVLLNFALMGHATVLYVPLSFALMGYATVLYVLLNFALMGHAKHPSVTQYVLMSCWRSSLQSPDPKRFLEDLEALL